MGRNLSTISWITDTLFDTLEVLSLMCTNNLPRAKVSSNPTSENSPAKLRLAFEAAPFGLLVEKAGGKTSDGVTGNSILDVQINGVDQRTALALGSKNEVERFNEMLDLN